MISTPNFKEFVAECQINESGMNRDLTAPTSLEYEGGELKVFANPETENWTGEAVRADFYRDLSADLKKAVEDKDDDAIKDCLQRAKETPIFGQDTSNIWKMTQVDGVEGKEETKREALALYAIKKIGYFLDWTKNNNR